MVVYARENEEGDEWQKLVNEEATRNIGEEGAAAVYVCVRAVCVCRARVCSVKRRLVSWVIVVTAGTATTTTTTATSTSASRATEARGGRSAAFVPRGNAATRRETRFVPPIYGGFVPTLGDSGGRAAAIEAAATAATAARFKRVSGR